jgi:hypothetical protein
LFQNLMQDHQEVKPSEVEMTDRDNYARIDWDGKLSNGMGQVKYQRKENDIGSGVRMVKNIISGSKHLYPVNEMTGEPVLPGMDINIYSVRNIK